LEADQAARAQRQSRQDKPMPHSHPPLKVVRLEPEPSTSVDPEPTAAVAPPAATPADSVAVKNQDSAPRPMIKGTGQKVYSTHSGAGSPSTSPSDGPAKSAAARGGP
jgi:hypothetical protein